ncbi:hypothetical protein V500_03681 [Pseudogymnoascus sp. VKM F-4518 (FW-2643)]|nr:hypothetical protein V500_03681 [Pseudogymnoascus sp. VKM F-4518 (FW-2643)]
MPPTKRALLIASPFGGLQGPEHDVETMTKALQSNGFNDITKCVAAEATRDKILEKWRELIDHTMPDDAVVFYYSGHGALVKPHSPVSDNRKSKSLQFIVPMDYDKSNAKDFRGIFDVEISHLLWQITKKTHNVTVILDCCHSGRMARNPKLGSHSSPKFLTEIQYRDDVDEIERKLQHDFRLDGDAHPEGNPFTVRIVAGTQGETAWEHADQEGRWQGALTRALGVALEEAAGKGISWHTTMIRVRDALAASNSPQHPDAEGPSKRIHFTLEETDPGVFSFDVKDKIATIKGGRVAGFAKNDVFALVPHGRESKAPWVAKAKLSSVDVFDSIGDITEKGSGETLPERGVAILIERALRSSPIKIPLEMIELQKAVESSKFLRVRARDETERMPSVRLEKDGASLYDEGGICIEVFCSPFDQTSKIVCAAENLTRAKMFQTLRPNDWERLSHDLQLNFDVVVPGGRRAISSSGETHVSEDEKACIWLHNKGKRTLYVNIFDVNVAGQIVLVNVDDPGGIEIEGQSTYVYGRNRQGEAEGQDFSWPDSVPVCEAIYESLVFIVTENIINLRHVESPGMIGRGEAPRSTLEDLTFQIACGGVRNYGPPRRQLTPIRFDVIEIPFTLHPRTCAGEAVPDPQKCEEWPKTLQRWPNIDESAAKGFFGAVLRAGHGIPPCIWVTNEYTEQITVVVSKLRPSRLWTGSELNASATGVGVTLSMETYALPAAKKTLGPYTNGQSPVTGTFPLWNRREGCGVVCIYLGYEERCFIMNDQVPIGATAVFKGQPDMEIIEYGGLER